MAKRRRGFDRRTAQPRAAGPAGGSRVSPRPANHGVADAAAAARRRRTAVVAAVGLAIGIVAVAFLGGALGAPNPSPSPPQPAASASVGPTTAVTVGPTPTIGGPAPVISGVACEVDEGTAYHVHSHLNIRFDGVLQPIPADVGIRDVCLYWLHTHSDQGVIHVEAPAETTFTLGQFFDVWGEQLSATQVLGRRVGSSESLFVFIDRQRVEVDPRTIELGDLIAIELQVGPSPLEALPYTFPADLQ